MLTILIGTMSWIAWIKSLIYCIFFFFLSFFFFFFFFFVDFDIQVWAEFKGGEGGGVQQNASVSDCPSPKF